MSTKKMLEKKCIKFLHLHFHIKAQSSIQSYDIILTIHLKQKLCIVVMIVTPLFYTMSMGSKKIFPTHRQREKRNLAMQDYNVMIISVIILTHNQLRSTIRYQLIKL